MGRQLLCALGLLLLLVPALAVAQGPGGGDPPPPAGPPWEKGPGPGASYWGSPDPTAKVQATAPASPAWRIERVDAPHQFAGMGNGSLALDADGHPHIAYGKDFLYYAHYDGSAWHSEVVDSSRNVGQAASLALDMDGRPHISYYDETRGDLKYAHLDGAALRQAQRGGWQIEVVDDAGDVGWYSSLALDSSGRPHISYWDATNDDLKYASCDGAVLRAPGCTWEIEVVDSAGNVGRYPSLVLDSTDRPHISYSGGLKYAYHDGATWVVAVVDVAGAAYTSLALDAAGRPHIGYFDWANHDLKYAHFDGTAWWIEVVDESRNAGIGDPLVSDSAPSSFLRFPPPPPSAVGEYASLALDSAGRPHISYYDRTHGGLKYAFFDGAAWQVQTVDGPGSLDMYTSLALDAVGRPHISYRYGGCTDYTLRHASFNGMVWHIEAVDRAGDAGRYTSLALDGEGWPHVAYFATGEGLKVASFDGSAWQKEVLDTGGAYISLVLDTLGRPHLSYGTYAGLKYAFFDGASWRIEVVDSAEAYFTSLALDAQGRPHISYYDYGQRDLKYAHWVAPDSAAPFQVQGHAWEIEVVDSAGDWGTYSSLALDAAGRPHISYTDWTTGDVGVLKYAHFDGAAWRIEVVDGSGGACTSLALDTSDRPHISYCGQGGLKYASSDGTAWQIEMVDGSGAVGWSTSLRLDAQGRPHISYRDWNRADLKYAAFDGAAWQIEVVDNTANVGEFNSLALDAEGRPQISYYDETLGDLKYACRQVCFPVAQLFLPLLVTNSGYLGKP